jgi:hypothetical protein
MMKKLNFIERLFPAKYDFYAMLAEQAKTTVQGVAALEIWLKTPSLDNAATIHRLTQQADDVRLRMEDCLIEAFVTPFDRQDIYSLSVEMDRIAEYAKSTLELMLAYEVSADATVFGMVHDLTEGTKLLYEAIFLLETEPDKSQEIISTIRCRQVTVEDCCRRGSAALFKTNHPIQVIKVKEIYHHIKDTAVHLGYTVDVLHRIVVRII